MSSRSVVVLSLLLLLVLVVVTSKADPRIPWQDSQPRRYRPGEESSLRDLDIGLGIGVPDAEVPRGDVDVGVFADPGGVIRKVLDTSPGYFSSPYLVDAQGAPPVTGRNFGVAVDAGPGNAFRKVVDLSPGYASSPYYLLAAGTTPGLQLPPPLPYQGGGERMVVDARGNPVMTARNLGDRQIGTFRLRNDQGYQVTMGLPQVPLDQGTGRDGILVMEMKATVYRPVP